jgi:syringate O-demethylase
LGYGPFVKFDHDFVGREALEKMAAGPHRRKVTLALDDVSVTDTLFGMFSKGELRPKYMEFPSAVYAMHPFDRVEKDGQLVGLSTWVGYSANEGKILTLAMVDESVARPGTELEFVWGEPDGGTTKPTVEPHKQVVIKAVVAAVPYSEVARTSYADSWRTKATL